jgi:hypothetical protein
MHEARDGPHHAVRVMPRMVVPLCALLHSLLNSSLVHLLPKNDVAKILGPFDVQKVPKSQKHAKNNKICFAVLKPNERGSFRRSPESMENMSMSS